MLGSLEKINKVIGLKQCKKAASEGGISVLYVALDADTSITGPVVDAAEKAGAEIIRVPTMAELGGACGIDVGASLVAALKD